MRFLSALLTRADDRRTGGSIDRAFRQRQPGQAAIELAIIVMTLMVMSFGVFEFGRAFHTYLTVVQLAREGARAAMDSSRTPEAVNGLVIAAAPTMPSLAVNTTRASGRATVVVTSVFTTPIPLVNALWGGGTFTIRHAAESRSV